MTGFETNLARQLEQVYPVPDVQPDWGAVVEASETRATSKRSGLVVRPQRRLAAVLAAVFVVAGGTGIGYGIAALPHQPPTWQTIINDWLSDGRIDGRYSCADMKDSVKHVSLRTFPTLADMLRRRARLVCSGR